MSTKRGQGQGHHQLPEGNAGRLLELAGIIVDNVPTAKELTPAASPFGASVTDNTSVGLNERRPGFREDDLQRHRMPFR